jgi:hypothetical protein
MGGLPIPPNLWHSACPLVKAGRDVRVESLLQRKEK